MQKVSFKFICQVKDTNVAWKKTSNSHVHLAVECPAHQSTESQTAYPGYLVCPRQGLTWLHFPLLWHFQIGESTREEVAQVLDSPAPSLTMFLMLKKISLATAQQDQSK